MLIYDALKQDHVRLQKLLSRLAESGGADQATRRELIEKIRDEIIPHARAEEAVFYNGLRAKDEAQGIVAHGYGEHIEAETILRALQALEVFHADWTGLARKLKEEIEHHIREEEEKIFPAAQAVLSENEARRMARQFKRMKPKIKNGSFVQNTLVLLRNVLPTDWTSSDRTALAKSAKALGLALVLTGSLFGCGKADEAADEIERTATTLEINDQWLSNCKNVSLDVFGVSSETVHYDIGASLAKTTTLFKENNCATGIVAIKEVGTYHVGDQLPNSEAYAFDERFESVTVTPLTEDGKDALNAIQACGRTDWAVNQGRDVTAQTSDSPALSRCWIKTPRNLYDIAWVSTNQLKFGAATDGKDKSTPEKRPTQIDEEIVYQRK